MGIQGRFKPCIKRMGITVSRGACKHFGAHSDMGLRESCLDGCSAVRSIEEHEPDVAILDVLLRLEQRLALYALRPRRGGSRRSGASIRHLAQSVKTADFVESLRDDPERLAMERDLQDRTENLETLLPKLKHGRGPEHALELLAPRAAVKTSAFSRALPALTASNSG
jgi:hypothetical protein